MAAHPNKSALHLSPHATCGACGASRPLDRVMVAPTGLLCDACAIGVESERNARLAARDDLGTGPRLAFATMSTVILAVVLSGPFPGLAEPLFAVPATGLAAGLAALSVVWGGWALKTGGYGRLVPQTAWATAVRVSGGVAALTGVVAGGLAVALAALPYVLLALGAPPPGR